MIQSTSHARTRFHATCWRRLESQGRTVSALCSEHALQRLHRAPFGPLSNSLARNPSVDNDQSSSEESSFAQTGPIVVAGCWRVISSNLQTLWGPWGSSIPLSLSLFDYSYSVSMGAQPIIDAVMSPRRSPRHLPGPKLLPEAGSQLPTDCDAPA